MNNSKIKIIVTGGCGFIGSHIVDKLINLSYDVHVIDDCSAEENESFYFNEKAKYYKISICEKEKIDEIFKNCKYVFHLAAESRIQPAIKNPTKAYQVNTIGTLNILELSKKYSIKKIVFSSTSSIYGLTNQLPTKEKEKTNCLNPYSHSKFLAEELFRHYSKIYKIDSLILRYFNVFGERSPIKGNYAPVVGIFLNQYRKNQKLTVVGSGNKKRDFIHVSDVVQANIAAITIKKKFKAKIINIGSGENISILDLAFLISKNVEFLPERQGEAENTLANIEKAKKLLNFKPQKNIKNWILEQIKK